MLNFTCSSLYKEFSQENTNILTIEEMIQLKGKSKTFAEYKNLLKDSYVENNFSYWNGVKTDFIEMGCKLTVEEEERDIITSLDVEKNKNLLSLVKITGPPWRVGLVINLSGKYDKNGNELTIKKKVKCLTILFLTNWSIEKTQKSFNNKDSVPCSTIKPYCGFLPVIYTIEGFSSLKMAKNAFKCWKEKTRGPFSRLQCGQEVFRLFRKNCKDLNFCSTGLCVKNNIKLLNSYKK